MDFRTLGDAVAYEGHCGLLGWEHARQGAAVTLANHDNALALSVLVAEQAAIYAMVGTIRGPDIPAEICAVDLCRFPSPAKPLSLDLGCHGFPQLVRQDEGALVGNAKVAREGQRALALNLVAEHRDCREVAAQGQLVRGKERARGNAEIGPASLAAISWGAMGAPAFPGPHAPALGAHGLAIGSSPPDPDEGRFR